MGRPPLPVGATGSVKVTELERAKNGARRFQARTRVRDPDGVTRPATATSSTASKARQALLTSLSQRTGPSTGQLNADTRYKVIAELWIAEVKKSSAPTTHDTYRSLLEGVVLPRFGELRLREVNSASVAFALEVLGNSYTANGVRQVKKVIAGPLEKAREWQLIPRNPVRDLGPVRGRGKKSRALTDAERARLLAFVDSDQKAKRNDLPDLFRFMLGTGCRIGEALGLRWRDLDLERSRCQISGSLIRVKGRPLERSFGKTDAAIRILWLPEFVVLTLQLRWDGRDMTPDQPVFCSAAGGWRDPNNMQRLVRYARTGVYVEDGEQVAVDLEWLTTHTFRRTAATLLDDAGLTPRQIADQLGHSRPSMSQDTYMARTGQGPERAAEALGKVRQ